jgi:hypothetical protein
MDIQIIVIVLLVGIIMGLMAGVSMSRTNITRL